MTTKKANEKEYTIVPLEGKGLSIYFDPFRKQSLRPYDRLHLARILDMESKITLSVQESSQKYFEETKNVERPSGIFHIRKDYCNPLSIGIILKTSDGTLFFARHYLNLNVKYVDRNNNIISEVKAAEYILGIKSENLKALGIVFDKIKQPCIIVSAECNLASNEVKTLNKELVLILNSNESLEKLMESHADPFLIGAMELYKRT